MSEIGKKLREIRRQKGLNQKQVAEVAGISIAAYSNIESEREISPKSITIDVGRGIAKALNVSFNELFEIEAPAAAGSVDESLLKEKIADLQKQIEQKDLLIDMLKSENSKHKYNEADDFVFQNFMWLNNLIFLLKLTTVKEIKEELLQHKEDLVETLSEISKNYIENKTLTVQQLLYIFFDTTSFLDLMEIESTTKEEFIINCTHFIHQFYIIDENIIRNYILKRVTTKWNPIKHKRYLKEQKEFLDLMDSFPEVDQNISKPD